MSDMLHVDDFVNQAGLNDDGLALGEAEYARWLLMHWRLPAVMKNAFEPFIADRKLFCTWEGRRWRCTGGSRLGDVWLTKDFNRDCGYERRVDVEQCSAWGPTP